jgi:dTDP-4-dehydrorhamnose 3,5-epimerase
MLEPQELEIHGAYRFALRSHEDPRGAFVEVFRQAWLSDPHKADYWIPVSGVLRAGLVDLRRGSPTEGKTLCVELDAATPAAVFIPAGVAHGYQALTNLTLMYLVDAYYDGSDEHGLMWNDPELGIDWPEPHGAVLSERDRCNPLLSQIPKEQLPRF